MRLFPRLFTGSRRIRLLITILVILVLIVAFSGIWCPGIIENYDVFSPTHLPSATPAATPQPSATPVPTPVPKPERFTIIWIADTQTIAYRYNNKVFRAMGEWIMANEEPLNIRYIVQTGDLVDNGYHEKQWESFNLLRDYFYGKIPYLAIAGNHDLGVKRQDYTAFLSQPFIANLPEAQKYKGGQAVWSGFQAGGIDFLLIGAGWGRTSPPLCGSMRCSKLTRTTLQSS